MTKTPMTLLNCYLIYFILTSCLNMIDPSVPLINTKYHICVSSLCIKYIFFNEQASDSRNFTVRFGNLSDQRKM